MMPPIFSLETLHRQYLQCRRNKRNTLNALRFEYGLEENLVRLREELEGRTYVPSRSVCFVLKQPKLREIFVADFSDRVVHHYQIIARRVRDEAVLWLARTVIFHDCTRNAVLKGDRALLQRIPPHKTLFGTANRRGLPIGNLTSQFLANVYLNELDQFVKHRLKARYFIRYCDDFVLLHEDKDQLLRWKAAIAEFLRTALRLALNDRRQSLGPIGNGVDFLGYIVRPDYLLVRRRVVNRRNR